MDQQHQTVHTDPSENMAWLVQHCQRRRLVAAERRCLLLLAERRTVSRLQEAGSHNGRVDCVPASHRVLSSLLCAALAINCDGSLVAGSFKDHTVRVLCARQAEELVVLRHRSDEPALRDIAQRTCWVLSWHPTRPSVLATGSLAGHFSSWDVCTGLSTFLITLPGSVESISFHPTGLWLVIAANGCLTFVSTPVGGPVILLPGNPLRAEPGTHVHVSPQPSIASSGAPPTARQAPTQCMFAAFVSDMHVLLAHLTPTAEAERVLHLHPPHIGSPRPVLCTVSLESLDAHTLTEPSTGIDPHALPVASSVVRKQWAISPCNRWLAVCVYPRSLVVVSLAPGSAGQIASCFDLVSTSHIASFSFSPTSAHLAVAMTSTAPRRLFLAGHQAGAGSSAPYGGASAMTSLSGQAFSTCKIHRLSLLPG